jgi:hypothetical protein
MFEDMTEDGIDYSHLKTLLDDMEDNEVICFLAAMSIDRTIRENQRKIKQSMLTAIAEGCDPQQAYMMTHTCHNEIEEKLLACRGVLFAESGLTINFNPQEYCS